MACCDRRRRRHCRCRRRRYCIFVESISITSVKVNQEKASTVAGLAFGQQRNPLAPEDYSSKMSRFVAVVIL